MKIRLSDHEATMFLPLVGRARESRKPNHVFFDPLAVSVLEAIDYDLSKLEKQISEYSSLSWSVRAMQFARVVAEFIQSVPEATVVNLGAGLDTTFYATDNGKVRWFNIDSEQVIRLRQTLLPANERVVELVGNVLEEEWLQRITAGPQPVLLIASGLLIYLAEDEIKQLFVRIADRFPACTIAFDRISKYSIQYIQAELDKAHLTEARIKWGIDDTKEMEKWDRRFKIAAEVKMFAGVDRQSIGNEEVAKIMDLNDQYNGSGLVILKCG
jgi:O-methyltransferase involved in polyketide biosynthesis